MFQRLKPIAYIGSLVLATLHCGGGGARHSKTPSDRSAEAWREESPIENEEMAPAETDEPEARQRRDSGPRASARSGSNSNSSGAGAASAAILLTDPEIAAITDAANNAEIEQATLAQGKSRDERVQEFAALMLSHHSQAQQQQSKLNLTKAVSPISEQLSKDARATLIALRQKNGADFDRAYLQVQIDTHRKVLAILDGELLPNAQDARLKRYLLSIKPKIEQHLRQAQTSYDALGAQTSGRVDSRPDLSSTARQTDGPASTGFRLDTRARV
jgi:putative membrane protein